MATALAMALMLPAIVASGSPPFLEPSAGVSMDGQCTQYHCAGGCGSCFNAGGREGALCRGAGEQTGYYCPAEMEQAGAGDVTFACMDWTFGSSAMLRAEQEFLKRTGDEVYFGIGTYGTSDDAQQGLGACYRLTVEGMDRDIIAQSVNTGHDVSGDQFDLQMGGGGVGAFNNCAGAEASMFPGSKEAWGCQYGGIDTREACAALPPQPRQAAAMELAKDSLVALCEYSWDKGVRMSGAGRPAGACQYNPTLLAVVRVRCPEELVDLTWMQRADEPEGYGSRGTAAPGTEERVCRAGAGQGTQYCLTRMMDCRKPSGAFKDNVRGELMVPGRRLAQTCTADGYTRINVQCGCMGCYC